MASDQQQAAPAAHESVTQRLAQNPITGFVPWILFWVIGGPSTWETAAIAALRAAVLVMLLSLEPDGLFEWAAGSGGSGGAARRRRGLELSQLKLLDVATVLFFAAFVVAALVTSRHDVTELDEYSQAISSGALGLIALGSIVFRHPFTTDYAKESAPPQVWHTAAFKRINIVLSSIWAAVFLLCAVLGVLSVHAPTKGRGTG